MANLTLSRASAILRSRNVLLPVILGLILTITAFVVFISTRSGQFGYKNKVYPGKTSAVDLERIMGKPQQTTITENTTIYQYQSGNQYRPNFVEVENDNVSLVKEQVLDSSAVNLNNFIKKYGQPESKIFSEQYGILAPGFIWSKPGVIVFANEIKGEVAEVWYFEPGTTDQFLQNKPELSKEEYTRF